MIPGRTRLAVVLLLGALSGCTTPLFDPALTVVSLVPEFDGEILRVSMTWRNIAHVPLGRPDTNDVRLHLLMDERVPQPGRNGGEQLLTVKWDSILVWLAPNGTGIDDDIATSRARDHLGIPHQSRDVGPAKPGPGENVTVTFLFLTTTNLTGNDGYYSIFVDTDVSIDGKHRSGHYYSGCFNRDTAPFYGSREGGRDCPWIDSTGQWPIPGMRQRE